MLNRIIPGFLFIGSILCGTAPQAATILVLAHYDTLTSAIAAAVSGDTVEITDSATYTETLLINKPIRLVASSGSTPTIRSPAGGASHAIYLASASAGAKIGSLWGGRITVSVDPSDAFWFRAEASATTTTLENLELTGNGDYGLYGAGIGTFRLALNHVNFNMPADSTGYAFRPYNGMVLSLHFTRCRFIGGGAGLDGMFFDGGQGNIVWDDCQFIDSPAHCLYFYTGEGAYTWTLNDCLLQTRNPDSVSNVAFRVYGGNDLPLTVNFNRTVLHGGIFAFYADANTDNKRFYLNHCDLRQTAGNGQTVELYPNTGPAKNMEFHISNSIISGNYVGLYNRDATHLVTADYCNVQVGPGLLDYKYSLTDSVTNDINTGVGSPAPGYDPLYSDPLALDFTYAQTPLKTASSTSTPVGSHRNFDILLPVELSMIQVD